MKEFHTDYLGKSYNSFSYDAGIAGRDAYAVRSP